ncbi:PqiC family protein [Methylobacter marinus]|uniref:PqiC family protein n=1 Tax=Methylobacter marinus TaxID=34058 RepID=UPI00037F215D|nr:PqiC family protein [Methylobacter marinus]
MPANRPVFLPLLPVLLLSLAACSSSPSQFFMLEPLSEAESIGPAIAAPKPAVILASVRIPYYVDRPQIVTAAGKNAYRLSELNRWAESLDHNIRRVLTQNLTLLVPAEVRSSDTSNRSERATFRVSVTILEFHADAQGQAGLTAQWRIARGDGVTMSRQVSYTEPASTSDYPIIVAALNECLNRLSRDLAAELRRLAG